MLVGSMNHPQHDVVEEIKKCHDDGMEFLDLTLEPPASASWRVSPDAIRSALEERRMPVVGHTAYYLPLESPFDEVRQGAVAEFTRCLHVFAAVGAKWMNIHPGRYTPMHPRSFFIQRNIESLKELFDVGHKVGVGLMIENIPGDFNSAAQLGELLDPLPELGLHLDIGHANLSVPKNTTEEILAAYGPRLKHVHLHDNKGGDADLHLSLGQGTMDIGHHLGLLKRCGYDDTITLEVFSEDPFYLRHSADVLRRLWQAKV